ncbi:MAG: hypothetical protein QNJ46_08505 [Leptolyngbyaceae cyanobacterium MO_188.B28]|nr:hypothetical protein [Leptolyngbyaceae cyanobacterium MO_188.B28]
MKRVSAITVCTLAALTACSRNEPLGNNWTFDPPDNNPEDDLAEQGLDAPDASAIVTQPEALGAEQISPNNSEQPAQAQRDFAWRGVRPSISSTRQGSTPSYRTSPVPIRSERLAQIRAQVLANLNGHPLSTAANPSPLLTRQPQPLATTPVSTSNLFPSPAPAQTTAPQQQQANAASPQLISSLQASAGPEGELSSSPRFSSAFQLQPELENPDLNLDQVVLSSEKPPQLIRPSSTEPPQRSVADLLIGVRSDEIPNLLPRSSTAASPTLATATPNNPEPESPTASEASQVPAPVAAQPSEPSQSLLPSLDLSGSAYVAPVSEEILAKNQLDLTQFVFSDRFTLSGLPLHSPAFWFPETSSTFCFKPTPEQQSQLLGLERLRRRLALKSNPSDCLVRHRYLAQLPKD